MACGAKDGTPAAGGAAGGPPPATVGVITVANQAMQPCRPSCPVGSAPFASPLRARVNGVVVKRLFKEGSTVKAGQLLYQIDPAPYQAALESAQASLAKAQANVAQASAQVERNKPLVEANAVSKQEFTTLVTTQKQAEADMASAKAAVQTAQINLDYAAVRAPIAGRIGQALVTEGALSVPPKPRRCRDPADQHDVRELHTKQRRVAAPASGHHRQAITRVGRRSVPVRIVLEDGTELPTPGKTAVFRPDR